MTFLWVIRKSSDLPALSGWYTDRYIGIVEDEQKNYFNNENRSDEFLQFSKIFR